ncbi:MAG: diguanylate cyclase [Clostridiales bacterium]|nr:diguanylate cyclase [Clostridiales bacterium]
MDSSELEKHGYKLVWQDEFDGQELNKDSWSVEERPAGWHNDELQSFVDDGQHVFIKDDHLVIRPERIIAADKSVAYKSGRINTKGKVDFTYGYVEARVKTSYGKGFLTAFRLLSSGDPYGEWPRSGSVDIFVADGQYTENGVGIIHFGHPSETRSGSYGDGITDLSTDFHTYGVEWLPGKFNFYFDGKLYHTESYWYTADENGNKEPYPAPFDKPFHLEADVSIGGTGTANPVRMTSFDEESQAWIDYIRLYRKDEYDENVSVPDYEKHFKEPDSTGNYISNTVKDWKFELACAGEALCDTDGKFFKIDIINSGDAEYSVQLDQSHLPLIKGERYRVSFEAMATEKRKIRVAVTAPNVHWCRYLEDTNAELNTDWQTHYFPFEMTSPDDDNGRLEFNLGNSSSDATVCIKNIRFEKIPKCEDLRRTIAVVGSWDDAENFNLFVESLMKPDVLKDYVITAYTFGLDDKSAAEPGIGKEFVEFIDRFDMAAMFVFAEMLKTREIIEDLRDICLKKSIPVVFLEHQYDGVINAILNYASGFEKVVKHILDDHGCKNVKFIGGSPDNPFSIERENIYKRLMKTHGLKVGRDDIMYGDFWDATAARVVNEKLDQGMTLPDAFICANDSMALGVCDALKAHGYKVPDDCLVTGFDGILHGLLHSPSITTTVPDYGSLCQFVVDIVEGREAWENGKTMKWSIDYNERRVSSCGCGNDDPDHLKETINTLSTSNQDYFRHTLEMGKLVTRTLSMSNIDETADYLNRFLWLWKDDYYFIGITRGYQSGCVHSIFHGSKQFFTVKEKFYNLRNPIPDWEHLLTRDSGINVILFRQIRTMSEEYGYMCCAYSDLTIRKHQRFEEFGIYISAMVSSLIDKAKILEANRAISRLSERDYLTNLYNRRGFFEGVDRMLKNPMNKGKIFSLFTIDMDGLKYINDHYGHLEGDNALIILSKSLQFYAGENGICARYGGDEFAMALVGDVNIADDYEAIRERIHQHSMKDPFVQELDYNINASMGIAECVITDDVDLDSLIKLADMRMYEDKEARKGSNEIR